MAGLPLSICLILPRMVLAADEAATEGPGVDTSSELDGAEHESPAAVQRGRVPRGWNPGNEETQAENTCKVK